MKLCPLFLLAWLLLPATSLADMAGASKGVGDSWASACKTAQSTAGSLATANGRAEVSRAKADGKDIYVKATKLGECNCGRVKQGAVESNTWECTVSWSLEVDRAK